MQRTKQIKKLGLMVDCSRNSVLTVDSIESLITLMSKLGYDTLQLYTEDTYEVSSEPYFGYLRGRYSQVELKRLDAFACRHNIELIPCIQTLAHLGAIKRWPEYGNIFDCDDVLLTGEERVYRLIENMFSTLAACFTSRRVNIGMDEAHLLGLGEYLKKYGYKERSEIMTEHLKRVLAIAEKYGFSCFMWSDMFFRLAYGEYYVKDNREIPPDILKRIPNNIGLVYWDYYSLDKARYDGMLKSHKNFPNEIIFAGGIWTWTGLAPSNAYSIEAMKASIAACRQNDIDEIFFALWGDNGGSCSPFSVLPALVYAAKLAKGDKDLRDIKSCFKALTHTDYDTFMHVDLPNVLCPNKSVNYDNPSKYLLYNDCLLGIFDSKISENAGQIYREHAKKLSIAEQNAEWAFLFKPIRLLCETLYIKAGIGIQTRNLYVAKDQAGLKNLIVSDYTPLIAKIEEFYEAFKEYWDTLYKPHGFDVMDYRLGGLLQRIKHTIAKIEDFVAGKVSHIPELEEIRLDPYGGKPDNQDNMVDHNCFAEIVTVNKLS